MEAVKGRIMMWWHLLWTGCVHSEQLCVKKYYEGDRQTQPQQVTQKTHKRGRALGLNGRALSVGEEGLRISVD